MALKLNLVCENPDSIEEFEIIEEESNKDSPSNLYIKGPYMMAEGVNKNNSYTVIVDPGYECGR